MKRKLSESICELKNLPNLYDVFDKLSWKDLNIVGTTCKDFHDHIIKYSELPIQRKRQKLEREYFEREHEQKAIRTHLETVFGKISDADLHKYNAYTRLLENLIVECKQRNNIK